MNSKNNKIENLFDFIALDIETTGLSAYDNEIIEIGAVKYVEGKAVERFSEFVKSTKPLPQFIQQLTHITNEQVTNGLRPEEAFKKLQEFLGSEIIVCHNTDFDINFLNIQMKKHGSYELYNTSFDTLELSRIYLPFLTSHKLISVLDYFDIPLKNAHRAIFDADATGILFLKLLKYINRNFSVKINFQIAEVSAFAFQESYISILLDKIVEFQRRFSLIGNKVADKISVPHNYISHKPEKIHSLETKKVFGQDGLFSKSIPNYEYREAQIEMANEIDDTFATNDILLVEAGTGVGKSLAYLIPAIKFSIKKQERVVISTNTKNLQEQLFYKDLPTIKSCKTIPFTAVILKGRENYICEKKWQDVNFDVKNNLSSWEALGFLNIIVWKFLTKTGDISENTSFKKNKFGSLWKRLVADRHFCTGRKCSYFSKCYLMDIRLKAEKSNLIIVNHSLMLADTINENATLGNYEYLVVDEAHNLPDMASSHLGMSFSYMEISGFFSQMYSVGSKFQRGIITHLKASIKKSHFSEEQKKYILDRGEDIISLIEEIKPQFSVLFSRIAEIVQHKGSYGKLRIKKLSAHPFLEESINYLIPYWNQLSEQIHNIKEKMLTINSNVFADYEKNTDNIDGILNRSLEILEALTRLQKPDLTEGAFWFSVINVNDKKFPAGVLNYAPLNVADILKKVLYEKVDSIIFTSATIALRGVFKYFSSRIGLDLNLNTVVRELIVDSPFDYDKQANVIAAPFLPSPTDKFFHDQAISLMRKIIETSKTGTLILFTSYKDLNYAYEELSTPLFEKDIPLLAQGKGFSRSAILKEFKELGNAVLLGTSSFWEGVDVQGDSLSLLIIYKLPFQVPSEPIVEAYIEKLEAERKNSFMHYMLPNAMLKYRQGFGRLIRSKSDKGLVVVLDNRIITKRYGHYFKDIIPSKTIVTKNPVELCDIVANWSK